MRAFITLIVVAVFTASCKRDTPASAPAAAPVAGTQGGAASPQQAPAAAAVASAPAASTPSIEVRYVEPTNPAHRPLYEKVRERRVLEQAAEALSVVRLPKPLLLEFTGCDGDSNAYYDDGTTSIKFCYEFLEDIKDAATKKAVGGKVRFGKSGKSIPLQEAIDGPVVFVLFHESGHAVFDLLKVPVLGREEDAADSFAAISLLTLGNDVAMRFLRGASWAYLQSATTTQLDVSDFADIHSLDSQRYFNILCLAYGSDREYFKQAVTLGGLPQERADDCRWEYLHARYALGKLVLPSIDRQQLEYVKLKARRAVPGSH